MNLKEIATEARDKKVCCSNCKFYYEGECRRYPPKVFVYGDNIYTNVNPYESAFPEVSDSGWCGEFKI